MILLLLKLLLAIYGDFLGVNEANLGLLPAAILNARPSQIGWTLTIEVIRLISLFHGDEIL